MNIHGGAPLAGDSYLLRSDPKELYGRSHDGKLYFETSVYRLTFQEGQSILVQKKVLDNLEVTGEERLMALDNIARILQAKMAAAPMGMPPSPGPRP